FEELPAMDKQMPAPSAELVPEHCRADGGEQQAAYPGSDRRLLKVTALAPHLDAQAVAAHCVLIDLGKVGEHIVVGRRKQVRLFGGARNTGIDPGTIRGVALEPAL